MTEHIVDVRWLAPPEPFERALAALDVLAPGERLRLLIHREPYPLYDILQEWGYARRTHACDDGSYEILIWREEKSGAGGGQASA